jgi:ATP-dependent RNA helicase RhlE
VLIFTRTKHRAKRVGEQLEKAGYHAASLQGNLSQNRRQAALDGFRDGTYQILVATDIAARGIDVSQISHVINYDIPDTSDAYIHRIGRTGRAARTGDAFTLVTGDDSATVRAIEKVLAAPLERRTLAGFDYSVPAPKKETEFIRPPRQAMPARKPKPVTAKKTAARVDTAAQPGAARTKAPAHPAPAGGAPSTRFSHSRRAR